MQNAWYFAGVWRSRYTPHSTLLHSTLCNPPSSAFHILQCTGTLTGKTCTRLTVQINCFTKVFYVTAFGFVWAASLFAAELLYETANHWQLRGWWVWRHAPRWTTESAPSLLCKDRGEPWGCERLQKGWVFGCGKAQLHSWPMPQKKSKHGGCNSLCSFKMFETWLRMIHCSFYADIPEVEMAVQTRDVGGVWCGRQRFILRCKGHRWAPQNGVLYSLGPACRVARSEIIWKLECALRFYESCHLVSVCF